MKLTAQVLDMKVGSATRKLVLVCMADIAGKDGTCYPSYRHIADQCEMSKRSVIAHISALEAQGFLKKYERKTPKGNSSNFYKITLEGSENIAPPPSENSAPPIVQDLHGGSENIAPPPSENSAPRTSHSSEPVNEPEGTEADRVALYLHKKILSQNPDNKSKPKGWVKDIERAIRIDERTEAQLICIIDWMYSGDMFWASVVQSGKKLREKYDTMIAQKRQRETPHETHQQGNQLRGAAAQSASFHEDLKLFAKGVDSETVQQDAGDIYAPLDKRVSNY
ncbi:MAG TPA: helix-turn-helix domain-containing protein [Methylophaga aminisulfidivorans]|uniref:Helix-turn-helix domain-containing protein n=2 Tax=root TaxID=1 RepID=A0A7C1VQT6_9GAMM|nr:helix-turn-helix domain-containing protein [Methylophaga aminisulfidivorans]